MKNTIILSSIACLFFWSCKTKTYTPDNLPERKLIFGEGGGFTGKYTTWLLLENGQMFQRGTFDTLFTPSGNIKKSIAKKMYAKIDSSGIMKANIKDVGNYTYSMRIEKDSMTNEISWSNEASVNTKIVDLYKSLHLLTLDLKKEEEKKKEEK